MRRKRHFHEPDMSKTSAPVTPILRSARHPPVDGVKTVAAPLGSRGCFVVETLEAPAAEPVTVVEPEIRVLGASPIRCPWCHDAVAVPSGQWVACALCLARHHADCWAEATACASCRQRVLLTAEA